MNVWICIAYDPLPGIDHTTRLLRYGTLAEQLAEYGHNVVLWTSTYDHWRKSQRFDHDQSVTLSRGLRVELMHAPAYRRNISLTRLRHNRTLAHKFADRMRSTARPDVIFAGIPCLELTEAAVSYARENGVPVVADVQDIWPEVYVTILPRAIRPLGRLILHREFTRARRIFRNSTAVTAVSHQYLSWAQKVRGGAAAHDAVFHLGYRFPAADVIAAAKAGEAEFRARIRLPADRTLALFLGQFAASYDIETIIAAARMLGTPARNLQFVLAGAGDKMERVQRAAAGLETVTLTGWLDYRDTLTLLQTAHIGLAAYARRAPQSLPYKPFEYMAFGLPIISSLGGELRELIETQSLGASYQAGDADSLAGAVLALATSPEQRASASRRCKELFATRYDAILITGQLIAHLDQLTRTTR